MDEPQDYFTQLSDMTISRDGVETPRLSDTPAQIADEISPY
jgi:hypothetical protein